jgi:hypothetical protein
MALDIHCEIDDGFTLCGGNYVPRVPLDRFIQLGELLANASPTQRYPWQRCPSCAAMITERSRL